MPPFYLQSLSAIQAITKGNLPREQVYYVSSFYFIFKIASVPQEKLGLIQGKSTAVNR